MIELSVTDRNARASRSKSACACCAPSTSVIARSGSGVPSIDRLAGTDELRSAVEQGTIDALLAKWAREAGEFQAAVAASSGSTDEDRAAAHETSECRRRGGDRHRRLRGAAAVRQPTGLPYDSVATEQVAPGVVHRRLVANQGPFTIHVVRSRSAPSRSRGRGDARLRFAARTRADERDGDERERTPVCRCSPRSTPISST